MIAIARRAWVRLLSGGPRLRNVLVQIHRYLGLTTLLFLVIAATTGVALVFSEAEDALLNPRLFNVPDRGLPPLAAPKLIDRFEKSHPMLQIVSAPLITRSRRAVELKVAPRPGARPLGFDQVFVDPYQGSVVGVRDDRPGWDRPHLLRAVYLAHYTLLAGDGGRWFMGVAAIGWTVGNIVGFYLTLPTRRPFWRRWRPVWVVNVHARAPRLLLDLHRASGLWLMPGVLVLSLSAVAMNFYDEAFRPAVVALSPPRPTPWDHRAPAAAAAGARLTFSAAERFARAAAARDGLKLRAAVETYDPDRHLFGVRFTSDGLEQYAGFGPVSYYVDDRSGHLVSIDNPSTDSAGEKVLRSLFPWHSGQVGGLVTRLLVGLTGFAIIEMSITGLIVWWRKRTGARQGRA